MKAVRGRFGRDVDMTCQCGGRDPKHLLLYEPFDEGVWDGVVAYPHRGGGGRWSLGGLRNSDGARSASYT